MKLKLAAASLCLLTLTACGSAEDGTDFAGNTISQASPAESAPQASPAAEEESEAPAAKEFDLGYNATVSDDEGDLIKVMVANQREVSDEFLTPERARFLAFDVTAEAVRTADINPFDFKLLLSDGTRLEPTIPTSDVQALNYATLNSGEKLLGAVVFDAPAEGVVGIAYAPLSQVLGTWKAS